jgi:hypothetical protein
MAYTFTPRSGKFAQVRLATNVVFVAKRWKLTPRVSESDTSNFEAGGQEDLETGITGMDVEIEFDWDASQPGTPYDAPLSLQPGNNVPMKIYVNGPGGAFWNLPLVKVLTCPNTAAPREMVSGTFTGKAKPGWTFISGTF